MTEIPLTIEELLQYGQFDEAEKQAILSQISEAILRKQQIERLSLTCMVEPSFFRRLLR